MAGLGTRPQWAFLQVIFVVDPEETVYVIHARPLNEQEKRRLRRKQR